MANTTECLAAHMVCNDSAMGAQSRAVRCTAAAMRGLMLWVPVARPLLCDLGVFV